MRVVGAVALIEMMAAVTAQASTFTDARNQYDENHVALAEQAYAQIAADRNASAADRSASERELARIAWLIDGNSKSALAHLANAAAIGDRPCSTNALVARVLREAGRDEEAVRRSHALLAACSSLPDRDRVLTHLIGARLDLAFRTPGRRGVLLAEARSEAVQFSPDADVDAARVRLETALLTDDAAGALAAWKDYFWLSETDAPQALTEFGAKAIFNDGLKPGASVDDRLKLAELLMRAGFAEPSRRFAYATGLANTAPQSPTWARLQAYWREREKIEATLLAANRGLARGKDDGGVVEAAVKAFTMALMQAAGTAGDPRAVLLQYYGLAGTVGTTNGYPSAHIGHVVEDRNEVVSQFGHSAKIHFMAIDNLITNGFTSWLWDGSATVGGWTANGVIVHVRPGYVQSPLSAYQQTQDSDARRRLIESGTRLGIEDISRLKQRPVATLEGLNARLQLQLIDRVAAVARTKAADPAGFRRAFLAEYYRASLDQSIIRHEGRHAIDEALGIKVEQPVLEYQAKLSELELADYPRLALQNMDGHLEGDGPHDRAGAKIFDQFRRWMEAHTDEIMDYDTSVPVLAQLDKLSDDQIRNIAGTLDPLPNGNSTPAKLIDVP